MVLLNELNKTLGCSRDTFLQLTYIHIHIQYKLFSIQVISEKKKEDPRIIAIQAGESALEIFGRQSVRGKSSTSTTLVQHAWDGLKIEKFSLYSGR